LDRGLHWIEFTDDARDLVLKYKETYDEAYILTLVKKLAANDEQTVVLTGVSYGKETTGVVVYKNGKLDYYEHEKIEKGCHGTGDVYASAFVGAYMNGKTAFESAKIAADYTVSCIKYTQGDEAHWYGVKFEPVLGEYINLLKK
jgi:pyridoxine kinase